MARFEMDDLRDKLRDLQTRKANYFNGDDNPNKGDRGYQNLLLEIFDISEEISAIEAEEDEDIVDLGLSEIDEIDESGLYYDNADDFNI